MSYNNKDYSFIFYWRYEPPLELKDFQLTVDFKKLHLITLIFRFLMTWSRNIVFHKSTLYIENPDCITYFGKIYDKQEVYDYLPNKYNTPERNYHDSFSEQFLRQLLGELTSPIVAVSNFVRMDFFLINKIFLIRKIKIKKILNLVTLTSYIIILRM